MATATTRHKVKIDKTNMFPLDLRPTIMLTYATLVLARLKFESLSLIPLPLPIKFASRSRSNRGGSQIAEFAAALLVLLVLIFIPLLDLTIVPVRWMMAQEIVNDYARKLALSETFSKSYRTMESDPSLRTRLAQLGGVSVRSIDLHLRVARVVPSLSQEDVLIVSTPGQIPSAWLPDGTLAPCLYTIVVNANCMMSPAILLSLGGASIPGLSEPISFQISASHEFANLGRNPKTEEFFLNE